MTILKLENICSPLIFSMTGAIFDDDCLELLIEIGVAQRIQGAPVIFDNAIDGPFTRDKKIDSVFEVTPFQNFPGVNITEKGMLGHFE
ncbi:hypothetical protein FOWG_03307 [Fusarium oxysporum f. sp. lycopersici MN25]|nr:hypothetical protein FOWG_03307 [Fusarium oxysporum f. sp. lycopersici MN25]